MPSFTKLLILSTMVAVGFALTVPDLDPHLCSGATLIDSTTIHAGAHDLIRTTHSCGHTVERMRKNFVDVCGASCTVSCTNVTGILPPISQDCQTIENSIVILESTMPATFFLQPGHITTLTFGTCSYFIVNKSTTEIEACWSDLSSNAHAAGAACFPPVQPFFPEGLCTAYDNTWVVGATHS